MNQHYVPQVYLKNFASAESSGKKTQYFVEVFNKQTERHSKINIKKICAEIDLYTLQEGTKVAKDLFAIEKVYSNGLEPLYAAAYKLLTNHSISRISERQRVEILLGILQLYPRNPQIMRKALAFHKTKIENLYKKEQEKGSKGMTYLNEDYSFRDYSLQQILNCFESLITNEFKEKHLSGLREIGEFHYNAIIEVCIIRNSDESEFVTSDNPLVLKDRLSDDENPLRRSKEFSISLNKKVAIKLYHDNRKEKNFIYRHEFPNGSVASFNKEIIEQTTRFVITTKRGLDVYQDIHDKFFKNTDLKLKMDALRQIMGVPADNPYGAKMKKIAKHYLDKYNADGDLSEHDQARLFSNISQLSNTFTKKIIAEKPFK